MSEQASRRESRDSQQETQQIPRQQVADSLVTDRGSTSIDKSAVSQLMDTVTGRAEGLRVSSAGSGRGSSIVVGSEEVAIDLKVSADYNRSILQVTETLRHDLTERIESLLGLRVSECNITVNDIYFPHEERQQQDEQEGQQEEQEEPRVR
ncbi:Asp23/Gls24 family envelope stress response protein [Rubrobacter aplysinae]|uniref:Asp23/Gls24 family envelope stress response protein n=1 Tax=Rubrobacter aplysinae TaxID=909625 RepID=UPI00069DCDA7|nr:Asp23/Gls24 family envelope stress response protein [Rubrobacter aplysinae]